MSENTPLKKATALCLAVYRITDKFPDGEILKQKLHTKSIDIIECLVYNRQIPTNSSRVFISQDLEREIRILFAYFSVAKNQGWVDRRNFSVLQDEYRKLYIETLEQIRDRSEEPEYPKTPIRFAEDSARFDERPLRRVGNEASERGWMSSVAKKGQERTPIAKKQAPQGHEQVSLTARQAKILKFLGGNEGGQAVTDIAGQIQTSNKTAERELKKLIGMGQARKQGNTRGARFLVLG